MSRVGRKAIPIPKDVKVQIEGSTIHVQGPKGKLTTPVPPGISFKLENGELSAARSNDERQQRAFHGLARALANNAVKGVTEGFSKELDIVGVGYKAQVEGKKLVLSLGFYITPAMVGGPRDITLSMLIAQSVDQLNWAYAATLSVLLLATALAIIAAFYRLPGVGHALRTSAR